LDVVIAGMTCMQLTSLVKMLLLIKVVVSERILGVISRVLTLAVYTLEGIRARNTICSCLFRRIGLEISFIAPSHRSVVFYSV